MEEEGLEREPSFRPEVIDEMVKAGWFDNKVPDWTGALCADHPDPDQWFRHKAVDQFLAIEVCQRCPIQEACLQYGEGRTEGVWGGVARRPVVSTVIDPTAPCPKCGEADWYYYTDNKDTLRRRCRECFRKRARKGHSAKKAMVAA